MWERFRKLCIHYFRVNVVAYFFLILLFIIGVVIGAMAVKALPSEQKMEMLSYLKVFFHSLNVGQTPGLESGMLLKDVLFHNVKIVLTMWFLGFTVIGIPFILLILFIRGFVIGFTVGFLVHEYILSGVLFAFAATLPHNVFMIPTLLFTGVSSISFSLQLVRARRGRNQRSFSYRLANYICICLFSLTGVVAAGCVEVYVSPVFMKLVSLFVLKG